MKYNLYTVAMIAFITYYTPANAAVPVSIDTTVKNGMCGIKVDNVDIANYKCEFSRAPSLLSYSYLYEAGKEILVFIDRPQGNACDGGPLHVISKTDSDKFKLVKTIDFCGGHYPEITSGPEKFTINIPSIVIVGIDKTLPAERWVLKQDELVKQ